MASARRDGVPAVLRGEVRLRVWVVVISGTLAAILLAYFGHRAYVETAAYSAHRKGTLTLEPAEVMEVNYYSGTGGYAGGNTQEVRYRLHSGGERTSLVKARKAYLNVDEGQTVRVGMWHGHLVTVEGQYVRMPWTPGASMVFLLLPPAFVLMVLQVYRLWRLRKEGPKYLFEYNSSSAYPKVAALLAFVTALVALSVDRVPWVSVPAFAVSALVPLAWFTVREIRERRTAPPT